MGTRVPKYHQDWEGFTKSNVATSFDLGSVSTVLVTITLVCWFTWPVFAPDRPMESEGWRWAFCSGLMGQQRAFCFRARDARNEKWNDPRKTIRSGFLEGNPKRFIPNTETRSFPTYRTSKFVRICSLLILLNRHLRAPWSLGTFKADWLTPSSAQ